MKKVLFKNEVTGDIKSVKIGFSFTLFFWWSIFIPSVMRRLHSVTAFTATYLVVVFILGLMAGAGFELADAILKIFSILSWGVSGYLGVYGNKMTAKSLLTQGYLIIEKDAAKINAAQVAWELDDKAFLSIDNKDKPIV